MSEKKTASAKEARNAYARKWRAKNRDKVKAAQDRYWDRVAERTQHSEKTAKADPERRDT